MTYSMTPEKVHSLVDWFHRAKRVMPWRGETDPYKIWISEIMLQQTQVSTVIPYYQRWMNKFPHVSDVAQASLQDILKMWEGLGYYTRARNLYKGAIYIENVLGGEFPKNRNNLLKIPGIGPYTSAAIASIAYNQPYGVVDGNVSRVMARLYRIGNVTSSARFKATVTDLVNQSLAWESPRRVNQAWMELGALVCTPNPSCSNCPLQSFCEARQHNCLADFPVKPDRKKIPVREGAIFIIQNSQKEILLVRRRETGLLPGLWELPNTLYDEQPLTDFTMANDLLLDRSYLVKAEHTYSHFKVIFELYDATLHSDWWNDYWDEFRWVNPKDLKTYPRPKVHIKAMKIAGFLS
ncbi:MAG: A/G-specific adenine glycosylase [Candidatus Neomarinimicrobiota bacterium]|nr:MAG: A/G-specific adenine glycosylase [Candidatus Neomarinimicrobiota bacterium]